MEDKALNNVVDRGLVKVKSIDAEVAFMVAFRPEYMRHYLYIRCKFKGKELRGEQNDPTRDRTSTGKDQVHGE